MGLQEQIAEAITGAFEELGGNPLDAVTAARRHATSEDWIQQESAITAFAGGIEMAVPGLHALTIPAGISFLMHKLARIGWGIGALEDVYIVETNRHSDLRNILTLWANEGYYSPHLLEFMAVDIRLFLYACTDEGYLQVQAALAKAEAGGAENVLVNTLRVLKRLVDELSEDERAIMMVQAIAGDEAVAPAIEYSSRRLPEDASEPMTRPMSRRISTRLAGRIAARISARVPARLLMGFIPLAGPIVNAFFNAQTLLSMAETARKYYTHPFTRRQLEAVLAGEDAV